MALIIVADDEVLLADLLIMLLEDEGHEVRPAQNGAEAFTLMQERRPDLLITDFMMPAMTGLELANAVRGDERLSDVPVLLVSGAQGAIARTRPELFDVVIDKPYKVKDLLRIVNELLVRSRTPRH